MKTTAKRFIKGAAAPFSGFGQMLNGARVGAWAIVPALVTSGLFAFGIGKGFALVPVWIAQLLPSAAGFWSSIGVFFVTLFAYILFLVGLLIAVMVFSKIVVIPFNTMIAEKILKHKGVIREKPFRFEIWMRRSIRQVLLAVFQVVFFGAISAVLVVLSFVPGLGIVAAYIGFLMFAFDCSDYAMEIADLGFRQKMKILKNRFPEYSGMALVLGLTFCVPVLNFFLLPIAVAGATVLLSEFNELWPKESL